MGLAYSRDCFHFLLLGIWACAVQHLEEVRRFCPHPCVNIGLRANTTGVEAEPCSSETALLALEVCRNVWKHASQGWPRDVQGSYVEWSGGGEVNKDHDFLTPPEPSAWSSQQQPGLQEDLLLCYRLRRRVTRARERRCCASSHLGALDVVVQVVPERVDQVDGVVSSTGIGVAREQH